MFSIFKSKPILNSEDTVYQIATYKWLLINFGGDDFYDKTQLILPTKEYFPSKVESANDAAIETFNAIKKYAGMEDWPCNLKPIEEDFEPQIAPTFAVQNGPNTPHGTFEVSAENEVIITYNPSLVSDPAQLVATFAHELAHYLTGSISEAPPGGWDNLEFATDIAATFLGFGVFMSNSAFNFRQFTEVDHQGWQYSSSGYLSEAEHIFALAIFLGLKGIAIEAALPYLKPNLKKMLKRAERQLSDTKIVNDLLAVEYSPPF